MIGPQLRYPISALVSFHYFPDPANVRELADLGLRLIGDSGAFSALSLGKVITLDRFAEWGHAVRGDLAWLASLDVIGDAEGSWRNWRELRAAGLDVVPTVHYGAPPAVLDRYAEQGVDFVGLGGMVGHGSEQDRLMRWTLAMMRYARTNHPGLRFHGWGISHPNLLMNLPWWSVDSSGSADSYRFGRIRLFDPERHAFRSVPLDGRAAYRLGPLLRRWYDTPPEAIATSTPGPTGNRLLHVRVAARSFQLLEDELRARHKVAPPTYGLIAPAPEGTGVHMVNTGHRFLHSLGTSVHTVSTATSDYAALAAGTHVHMTISSTHTEHPALRREATP